MPAPAVLVIVFTAGALFAALAIGAIALALTPRSSARHHPPVARTTNTTTATHVQIGAVLVGDSAMRAPVAQAAIRRPELVAHARELT